MAKDIDKIKELQDNYEQWLKKLEPYHSERFDNNYKQYTAYAQTQGTSSKISDPVAPELIERVIQKLFEREPRFFALGRGKNVPREVSNVMAGVIEYFWTNPDIIAQTGTMKSKLKMAGREFCVLGQTCVEAYYNQAIDMPDMRVIPFEDVIFDPSSTPKKSDKIFIRTYVTPEYLEDNVEVTKDGKVIKGIFKASEVKKIKNILKNERITNDPTSHKVNRSGSDLFEDIVGSIPLISCWDKSGHCIRFVYGKDFDMVGPLQEFDSILGETPFAIAQDIEVPKEPFALSILDHLNGLTQAKDMFINQIVDYGAKALNPPMFVDPSVSPINRATLANAFKIGGIVFANRDQVDIKAMPPLPREGMEIINYIQQRAESVSGIGSYLGGVPNQTSDKTKGTKGGILALIEQAVSPVRDRQTNLEESLIEPIVNKWLKLAAHLMGEDEIKYAFISGESPKWVKVTRGLLSGQITLADLAEAEIFDEEDIMATATWMAENGQDPETEILFDVDWVIRVEAGSLAEIDKEQALEDFKGAVEQAMMLQIPLDMKKVWTEIAQRAGVKEPEQYIIEQDPMMGGEMGQPPINEAPPIQGTLSGPLEQQLGMQPQMQQPIQ